MATLYFSVLYVRRACPQTRFEDLGEGTGPKTVIAVNTSIDLSPYGFGPVKYLLNSALRYSAAAVLANSDPNAHVFFVDDTNIVVYRLVNYDNSDSVQVLRIDRTGSTPVKKAVMDICSSTITRRVDRRRGHRN